MEVAAGRDVQALRGRVRGDDEVGAGREGVPVFSRGVGQFPALTDTGMEIEEWELGNIPADAIFLQLPIRTLFPVKDMVRVLDVFLELRGDFPLGVIGFRRRHRDVAAR